jgi:1-acyl-sn-glycerol-3-phosphate acyltransferase
MKGDNFYNFCVGFINKIGQGKRKVYGLDNLPGYGPAIYIANHLKYQDGPIPVGTAFPFRIYPWVVSDMFDYSKALKYIHNLFGKSKLGIRSYVISPVLAGIFSWGFNHVEAIPVYRDLIHGNATEDTDKTYRLSVEALLQGKPILIFPENQKGRINENEIYPFKGGALKLLEYYFSRGNCMSEVSLYPIAVTRFREVMFSTDIKVQKEQILSEESLENRIDILSKLEKRINAMCKAMLEKKEGNLEQLSMAWDI